MGSRNVREKRPTKPSDVSENRGWFDHFADVISDAAATQWFFLACVGLLAAWAVVGPMFGFSHGWVDVLQSVATLTTLLLVAMLENEEWRGKKATQRKLDAIAGALAHLLEDAGMDEEHIRQLTASVGIEKRESASSRRA
ncbi:hypothetical protein BH18ACT4_BH18ACT4_05900 [soil metagenome]